MDMKNLKLTLIVAALSFCGFTVPAVANTSGASGNLESGFALSQVEGDVLQLEANKAPMAKVLKAIAAKSRVDIHFSALPAGVVTATCIGNVKKVLECLLDGKADLIMRYPNQQNAKASKGNGSLHVAEAWILGSTMDSQAQSCSTNGDMVAQGGSAAQMLQSQDAANQDNRAAREEERVIELVEKAQAKDAEERADAIGELLSLEIQDNPKIGAALERALTDNDPQVRAQAISSYANRDGVDATAALEQALKDDSEDVRLMAVDSTDNVALLQQAANDSDENVRTLAGLKIGQLNQQNIPSSN